MRGSTPASVEFPEFYIFTDTRIECMTMARDSS